jgi:hypothetical protein
MSLPCEKKHFRRNVNVCIISPALGNKKFTVPSAVANHLGSGGCLSRTRIG